MSTVLITDCVKRNDWSKFVYIFLELRKVIGCLLFAIWYQQSDWINVQTATMYVGACAAVDIFLFYLEHLRVQLIKSRLKKLRYRSEKNRIQYVCGVFHCFIDV